MAAEPDDVAKAHSGLVTPDGRGGFGSLPKCVICQQEFHQGDVLIQVVADVQPNKLAAAHGHLACALSVMQAQMKAFDEARKETVLDMPAPGPGEAYDELHKEG